MKKFKEVHQNQIMLLPPSLDEFIDQTHLVRVLDSVVDRISSKSIEDRFTGGGTPSYHPRMMLKVILYAYICHIYSCRKIAKALREDLPFMWLSGLSHPDFNTVNRFRSEYFRDNLEDIFGEILLFLEEEGYIDLKDYFVDGKKICGPKDLGISKKQIRQMIALKQKKKINKIKIKEGIPFVPSFLIAFILSLMFGAWWMLIL